MTAADFKIAYDLENGSYFNEANTDAELSIIGSQAYRTVVNKYIEANYTGEHDMVLAQLTSYYLGVPTNTAYHNFPTGMNRVKQLKQKYVVNGTTYYFKSNPDKQNSGNNVFKTANAKYPRYTLRDNKIYFQLSGVTEIELYYYLDTTDIDITGAPNVSLLLPPEQCDEVVRQAVIIASGAASDKDKLGIEITQTQIN